MVKWRANMSYIGAVPRSDLVFLAWRVTARDLLRTEMARQKTRRRTSGETIAAGDSETKLLWHKASTTELLVALRNAADEIMQRALDGMAALQKYSQDARKLWQEHWVPSSPHQELIPWCGWLRAIAARRITWMIAYPEEEYLHP